MIEYGITKSEAQVWIHVCPRDAALYWYPRKIMLQHLSRYPVVEIRSARGHLVKLNGNRTCDGGFIHDLEPPLDWWKDYSFDNADSDDAIGGMAEALFERCVKAMLFGIPAEPRRYTDRADQFSGKDFALHPYRTPFDVEVKADIPGGEWGTGNLFVQTHEYKHDWSGRNTHRENATA